MANGGENGDPPGVELPGAGADEVTPPGGGSSVDDRNTSAGTRDAGARGARTLFQPLPPGLDPTGTCPPAGAPSGSTLPEAVLSGAGTHFGVGQLPDVTTWGGGSVPPPAREPAVGSSSRAPQGSRSAKGAPALEHSAGTHGIDPRPSGPVGDPLLVLERGRRCQDRHEGLQAGALVVLPQAHGEPGMASVLSGETPWPRSFVPKLPDR